MTIFNFEFNWNNVAAICPEYLKYLVADCTNNHTEPACSEVKIDGGQSEEEDDIISEVHSKDDECLHTSYRKRNYEPSLILKPMYNAKDAPTGKMNPLQLMPPKSVLDAGSKMTFPGRKGWATQYTITSNMYNDNTMSLCKTRIVEKEDKITLVRAKYWFDPCRNIVKDQSGEFKCLTYNKKTKCLYYLFREPKRPAAPKRTRRYRTRIQGLLWNANLVLQAFGVVSPIMIQSFIDLVEEAVLRDVPDAFIPEFTFTEPPQTRIRMVYLNHYNLELDNFTRRKLLVLIIQHKAGSRLDWLTEKVFTNISCLLSIEGVEARIEYKDFPHPRDIKRGHKRMVSRIVPSLRASRSLKHLLKSVLGKFYSNLYLNLVKHCDISGEMWIVLLRATYHRFMPKYIYHWITELTKNESYYNKEVMIQIVDSLRSSNTLNPVDHFVPGPPDGRSKTIGPGANILETWVKITKRFIENGQPIVAWSMWRDMYNMADELSIRIRPNKLMSAENVHDYHNILSDILDRDRRVSIKYKDLIFREFESPNKMYGKFKFTQLETADELVKEGRDMHHCVGGYAGRCADGYSIIFSMHTDKHSYVTIELDGRDPEYPIRQKYTINDVTVTSESIIETIEEWHKDTLRLHKGDTTTYYRLCAAAREAEKLEEKINKINELRKICDSQRLINEAVKLRACMNKTHTAELPWEDEDGLTEQYQNAGLVPVHVA